MKHEHSTITANWQNCNITGKFIVFYIKITLCCEVQIISRVSAIMLFPTT